MTPRIAFLAAAILAAAFLFILLPLPARTVVLPRLPGAAVTLVGACHIHTNRSDGSGSPDEVAAAAARAGLQFIILTDHGDGTREPAPPRYRSGVLVIDAVELSTAAGHYIAIGLPRTPYPLRGEPRDVVEDVRRLGGFGIVAHPDSAKPGLRWHDWDAPVDAIEWLNADTEWRDESPFRLARALAHYPARPVEAMASLLDRPDAALSRWDVLTRTRRVVALAGADAHARTGLADEDSTSDQRGWFLRVPSYELSFRTFAVHVVLDRPLEAEADSRAAQVMTAIRAGRVYSAIDALASPAALEFSAAAGKRSARQGDLLENAEGPVMFTARSNGSAGGSLVLRKDGRILSRQPLPELAFESTSGHGAYRVEVYLPDAPGDPPVPWIVSNPIYVQPQGWGVPPAPVRPTPMDVWPIQGGPWHVEKDEASTAAVSPESPPEGPVVFRYQLAGPGRTDQYAALGVSVGSALVDRTSLAFRAQASRPMRVSVQVRRPRSGERWQRSIYLDATVRDITVPFDQLTPVGDSTTVFDPSAVDTVLFVVDAGNATPGSDGRVSIIDLRLAR